MATAQNLHELAKRIQDELLDIFINAQQAASDSYLAAIDRGADIYTFGVNSWSYTRNLIRRRVKEDDCSFSLEPGPGCVLLHGAFRIRHHRVGQSDTVDIHSAFPQGAQQLIKEFLRDPTYLKQNLKIQPVLFELESFFNQDELAQLQSPAGPTQVVLAYVSHPEHGLRALYLATIGRVEDGQISEWATVVEVWKAAPVEGAQVEIPEEAPSPLLDYIAQRQQD